MIRKPFLLLLFCLVACGGGLPRLELTSPTASECSQDEKGNLILRIGNLGKKQSIATTTQVEFPGRPPFLVPTRPIPSRDSTEILVPVPEGCEERPCRVRVRVDAKAEATDQDPESKQFEFLCRLRPFRLQSSSR